jgi:hypothetical protein
MRVAIIALKAQGMLEEAAEISEMLPKESAATFQPPRSLSPLRYGRA